MAFCLPLEQSKKFIEALKSGEVNPGDLALMTSAERHSFFSKLIGEADSLQVNSLFESKLLLKNQQQGMINWAKSIAGISEVAKRDIFAKIEKMTKVLDAQSQEAFLQDLASKKLGTDVTLEEANVIADLSKTLVEKEKAYDPKTNTWKSENDRIEWGANKIALMNYVADLKLSNRPSLLKTAKTNPGGAIKDAVIKIAGFSKSLKASFDNSFWGRQGFKAIFTNPKEWSKNFLQSWVDIAKQLVKNPKNDDILNGIKADINSRPNAMNGTYKRMKLDTGVIEEAYPTSLPERIPILGNIFKASEVAYSGGALRLRADIADKVIQTAKDAGVDVTNKLEAESIGNLVNSLTGRGNLGKAGVFGNELNTTIFSVRSLKSSFDFLTAHQFQKDVTPFVRKQAAINLLKVTTAVAVILVTAKQLGADVETDPRSADFGKIKIGNTRIDVTGGMASLATLTARVLTQRTKSTTTGKITKLNLPKYGARSVGDVLWDFAQNKLSPAASVINDFALRGTTFAGKKPTIGTEALNAFMPLPIINTYELLNTRGAANVYLASMLDALGFVTNTYDTKN